MNETLRKMIDEAKAKRVADAAGSEIEQRNRDQKRSELNQRLQLITKTMEPVISHANDPTYYPLGNRTREQLEKCMINGWQFLETHMSEDALASYRRLKQAGFFRHDISLSVDSFFVRPNIDVDRGLVEANIVAQLALCTSHESMRSSTACSALKVLSDGNNVVISRNRYGFEEYIDIPTNSVSTSEELEEFITVVLSEQLSWKK